MHLTQPGKTPLIHYISGRRIYDSVLEAIDTAAAYLLEWTYSPRLQPQLLLVVVVTFCVTALPLLRGPWITPQISTPLNPFFAIMWIVGAGCAIGAASRAKYHRPATLLLSGGAGLITCLTFAWLSAPDLALTQLAVEAVTIVLILLGLRWLPRRLREDAPATMPLRVLARRARDFIIAVSSGCGMAALSYAVLTQPRDKGISSFFMTQALPDGGGTNVVNVILVDFRGFDTFGEITVLGIVALTVYALLRRFRPPPESLAKPQQYRQRILNEDAPPEPDPKALIPSGTMLVPAVLIRLLLPMAALTSFFFLFRGHNLPGGGFVGGLIMATAIILQYMVGGVIWVESRLRIHPQYWIALGLLLAGTVAMTAWWTGLPFLSALKWELIIPIVGVVTLSSVLLFDIGVYMLVIGATILILVALAHQSLRFYRTPAATIHPRAAVLTHKGI